MELLLLAYHILTNCSPCPYNVLTICYRRKIDSTMRGEPLWACCSLHTIHLPLASHVLSISLLFATCPELTASCEGEPFWRRCLNSDYSAARKYDGRSQKERAQFCPRNPGQEISEQGSKSGPTNRPSHMWFILSHAFGAQKRAQKTGSKSVRLDPVFLSQTCEI